MTGFKLFSVRLIFYTKPNLTYIHKNESRRFLSREYKCNPTRILQDLYKSIGNTLKMS